MEGYVPTRRLTDVPFLLRTTSHLIRNEPGDFWPAINEAVSTIQMNEQHHKISVKFMSNSQWHDDRHERKCGEEMHNMRMSVVETR